MHRKKKIPRFLMLTLCGLTTTLKAEQTIAFSSSLHTSGTFHESLRREVNAAIDRSLDWFSTMQHSDGSWSNSNFPALTALPLWAFTQTNHPRKIEVENGAVQYILTCTQENGSIYKHIDGRQGGGLSNYNTAICMVALHATGRTDIRDAVLNARKFVSKSQYFGGNKFYGGFGYDTKTNRIYTDLLNTFYSTQAMRLTSAVEEFRPNKETKARIDWNATITFVERLQNARNTGRENAGGFFYNPIDPKAGTTTNASGAMVLRSYGSITYAGLLAMIFADISVKDPRVRSTLEWAKWNWTLDENPGMGQQGLYFFYYILTRGLVAAKKQVIAQPDGTYLNWKEAIAREILSSQKIISDTGQGYWINENGRFWENDPVLSTAYCVLALQAIVASLEI